MRRKQKDEKLALQLQNEEDALFARQLQQIEDMAVASVTPRAPPAPIPAPGFLSSLFGAGAGTPSVEQQRQQLVQNNLAEALEFNPEAFGQVEMLSVRCRINGNVVSAMVDTGAQMTVMSLECARRCGLDQLIDKRWQGIAQGVGQARLLGRVHLYDVELIDGGISIGCSMTVLDTPQLEMLIGLDMLRKHQCIVDMERDVLMVGGMQGHIVTFMPG